MEYFTFITVNPPNCIVLPTIEATQFEICPATISMLPSFHGLDRESAHTHLRKFPVCNTFKNQNINADGICFCLFPLHDSTTRWLDSFPPKSITSWDEQIKKIMSKYYPVNVTNSMRKAIQEFKQKPTEQFPEIWERF